MQAGIYVCHATHLYIHTGEAGNPSVDPYIREGRIIKKICILYFVQPTQISFHPKKRFLSSENRKKEKKDLTRSVCVVYFI